jgi:hypothetical protein
MQHTALEPRDRVCAMTDHTQSLIKLNHFAATGIVPITLSMGTGDATTVIKGQIPKEYACMFGAEMFADTNVVGRVHTGVDCT